MTFFSSFDDFLIFFLWPEYKLHLPLLIKVQGTAVLKQSVLRQMNEVRRRSLIFKDPGDIKFHISAALHIISDCGEWQRGCEGVQQREEQRALIHNSSRHRETYFGR